MYVSVKQWKLLHLNTNIKTKIVIIHSLVTTKVSSHNDVQSKAEMRTHCDIFDVNFISLLF